MHKIRNIKWVPLLMALTIIAITGFQLYWLQKSYEREERTLDMRTNFMFRETVRNLQASKLKLDRVNIDSGKAKFYVRSELRGKGELKLVPGHRMAAGMMDVLIKRAKDSGAAIIITKRGDSANERISPRQNRLMQFLYDVDSIQDSITVKEIETAYAQRLKEQRINVPFYVLRVPTKDLDQPVFNEVTLGFRSPITYKMELGNTFPFILNRMAAPILFSVFLVGFTILSFTLLYRNLIRQRKLADIKNEFISNITHELKTPIATVSVAIEALRSFSASIDQQKTKEYLDISANELQRLSLLVDKVLKLSMFEKKEIDLKYEPLDMKALVDEVNASMRLQFEKKKASVHVAVDGDTRLEGDRLHLVSVIFNLLDNALKYSSAQPDIDIAIRESGNKVLLIIKDSGIGISPEYHSRIFEKFFRVPTGNLHNAKGYGLGLSYVAHVIDKHKGEIKVESVEGDGTAFVISLPKQRV
jgi:two-component system, OmpR family, phosphate regulon sensor histidine kinase PhoR